MKLKTKTKIVPLKISWDEYLETINKVYDSFILKSWGSKPDYIFAPIRGGLIPGVILSHKLNVKMYAMEPDELEKTIHPTQRKNKIALFCDDIYDSGQTVKKCVKYLEQKGYKIITCAILLRKGCKFQPNVYGHIIEKGKYVIFPYENENIEMKNIEGDK
jgi:hypoxanthine phosphoribosyltransferase